MAACLVAVAARPSPARAAQSGFGFSRIDGADRFGTAALLAQVAFPNGAPTAVIADGYRPFDAVSAAYLAGQMGAPVLLVGPTLPVPPPTVAALDALRTAHVVLVGLSGSIGDDVQSVLGSTPSTAAAGGDLTVVRIGGSTRYDTMNLLDEAPGPSGTVGTIGGERTAIIASGVEFADALAAAPLAYAKSLPIVLTDPETLSPEAVQTLEDLGIGQVVIAGGPAAVSPGVEAAINQLGVSTLARLAGSDRSDTSRLIGEFAIAHLGFSDAHFDVASASDGAGGADALALAPLAAVGMRTIQLVDGPSSPGPGPMQFVRDHLSTLTPDSSNTVVGGQLAVSDGTVAPIVTAYNTGTGVTVLPELVGGQTIATTPTGTLVRFIFDQAVTGAPVWDRFLAYHATEPGAPVYGAANGGPGDVSMLDPVDPDAVLVNFPALTTDAAVADVTLVSVESGAITDSEGRSNPDGRAEVGTSAPAPPPGLSTLAPNLVSLSGLRASALPGATAVDVVFDKPAFNQSGPGGLAIVYADQAGGSQEAACQAPSGTSSAPNDGITAGGNGGVTWTIVCPDDPSNPDTPLLASQIGRIVAQPGAVGSAPAGQPADAVAGYGEATSEPHLRTLSPDLMSAVVQRPSAYGAPDQILITFDQPIGSGVEAGRFTAVLRDGVGVAAVGATPAPSSPASDLVEFPPGTNATVEAIAIGTGAVSGLTSGPNADDEIGAANAPGVAVIPGDIAGPQLSSAQLEALVGPSGRPVAESAILRFSQALAGPEQPVLGDLHGYEGDGTELTCTNGSGGAGVAFPDGSAPWTVVCDAWALGAAASGAPAPLAAQQAIVLMTVDRGCVDTLDSQPNPEGAVFTTGGDGTPEQD